MPSPLSDGLKLRGRWPCLSRLSLLLRVARPSSAWAGLEDAHSIQTVIRQVVQMVLQKRIERKAASLLLYALQIASSNLKRIELEKPQPEQVVIDLETESETPMAAFDETARDNPAGAQAANHEGKTRPVNASTKCDEDEDIESSDEDLPPGTIQACYRPGPLAAARVARTLLSAPPFTATRSSARW